MNVIKYHHYNPPGVRRVLASGTSAFIGEVDGKTILKYPLERGGDLSSLEHEHRLLQIVGPHQRSISIAKQGLTGDRLYLERASEGSLLDVINDSSNMKSVSLDTRLAWCLELVEAVAYVHSKNVIHCDINPAKVLLDNQLHIKLADFQGCHVADDGEYLMRALGAEPCRYFCPRNDDVDGTQTTDIFALGSTIHFIMTGEEPFSDIVAGARGWDDRYESANEVWRVVERIEKLTVDGVAVHFEGKHSRF
ncbi:ABC transporter CDR4 [Purpureocillium lavendulum]|uniref:ABC transporter CDR4 n=1 Tax=Purpureocillium lavendulum TaxID=1247861 RepID=A0AB34FKS2_9HYPO|nr:ABC transporter CDR4 [Purpureocillium lavendulum]